MLDLYHIDQTPCEWMLNVLVDTYETREHNIRVLISFMNEIYRYRR